MDQKSSVESKNWLSKLLPESFSALTFLRPTCNPNDRNKAFRAHRGRGSLSPIGVTTPPGARLKIKNSSAQEPSSPKISCMGQIKHRRKICRERRLPLPKESSSLKKIQKPVCILNILRFGNQTSNGNHDHLETKLGQVKKYSSDRNSFANFDWAVQIAPVEFNGDGGDEDEDEDEDEDTVALSADMQMIGRVYLKPRQEINLWKRRTMAQPKPLKLNTMVL